MTYNFALDVPQTLVAPALVRNHPVWGGNINGYDFNGNGGMVEVRALVIHTPEEAADNDEVTPRYFATPGVRRSTHYYADSDGDLFQMVSDKDAAWGQGTHGGNRTWKNERGAWAPWNPEHISNNQLSLGIEVEGRADTIGDTITEAQLLTVAKWAAYKCWQYNIPADSEHIVRHSDLAADKHDPGTFPMVTLRTKVRQLLHGATQTVIPDVPVVEPPEVVVDVVQPDPAEAYRSGYRNGYNSAKTALYLEVNKLEAPQDAYVPEMWRPR